MPTSALAVPAHAKLNLDLAIEGRRPDGYHELRSTFQAISLHDLLLVELAPETTLDGGFADALVLRAQHALEEMVGQELPARFRLIKRIPAGAGLAGGSSDAAATLRALARLHGLDVDLRPAAAQVGADVPFFLTGGAALVTGVGERLAPVREGGGWYAIAWPGFAVSTPDVYRAWDEIGGDGPNQLSRAAAKVEPKLAEFACMLGQGWQMTGSGSAFFRLCRGRQEAQNEVARLTCWAAVASPVSAWGPLP